MGQSEGTDAVETELDRDIGMVGAIALGVGTMIAAGIFVLSGLAVSNVGAMAIVSFLIAAVVASFTAFAYAEFAAIYPESGGGYAYVSNTFDTNLTYIVGWSMILGYPASAAFYLASFSDWFYRFILPLADLQAVVPYWVSGLVVLVGLVALNVKGTEETGQFQIVVTALKVALIALFLYGGLQAFETAKVTASVAEYTNSFDDVRNIGITSALVFITFFGFEAIATNAEEIESPGRTIPRAIFFSMGFVTLVYSLVVLVVVLAINTPEFLETLRPFAEQVGLSPEEFVRENGEIAMGRAAEYYLGPVGFYVIIVGALFSMLSAANATILAGSRVKLAMSRRNHLPDRFESLHDSFNTPTNAVFLTGGLIFAFVLAFTVVFGGGPGEEAAIDLPFAVPLVGSELHMGIEAIAHFADFMLLTGLIAVNFAIVRSRRKYPDVERAFTVPAVPYVPAVAVLANLVLVVNVEPGAFVLGILAELVGVVVWFGVVSPSYEESGEEVAPTVVAERHPGDAEYEVLVPIANPENVDQLMRTARTLAADEGGSVHVLSVVRVPEQTPLSRGEKYTAAQREVLDRAMAVEAGGGEAEVPVSGTIRIAHRVDEAIRHTIDESGCDVVLMGWHRTTHPRRDRILGTVVDSVARDAGCDVLVERVPGDVRRVESVFVPTAGGPHAVFAAEVAGAVARRTGASVDVCRIVDPDASERERETARESVDDVVSDFGDDVDATGRLAESDDVVECLLENEAAHDLTIIGATREGPLQRLVFGTIPEAVGLRAEGAVVMAKRDVGVTGRLRTAVDRLWGR